MMISGSLAVPPEQIWEDGIRRARTVIILQGDLILLLKRESLWKQVPLEFVYIKGWHILKDVCQTARIQPRSSPILPPSSAVMHPGKIHNLPSQEINHGYSGWIFFFFCPQKKNCKEKILQREETSKPPGKCFTDSREVQFWPQEEYENFCFIHWNFSISR